jgi:hypothetical protein
VTLRQRSQQLAFGLHPDELGDVVDGLDDIDPAKADAEHRRLVEAILAATTRPKPCRCQPGPLLDRDEWDGALHCCRCGREVAQ